jgi:hypothetical protein
MYNIHLSTALRMRMRCSACGEILLRRWNAFVSVCGLNCSGRRASTRPLILYVSDMTAELTSYVKERNYDNLMTVLIRGQYDVNRMSDAEAEEEGDTALHLACKASDHDSLRRLRVSSITLL